MMTSEIAAAWRASGAAMLLFWLQRAEVLRLGYVAGACVYPPAKS